MRYAEAKRHYDELRCNLSNVKDWALPARGGCNTTMCSMHGAHTVRRAPHAICTLCCRHGTGPPTLADEWRVQYLHVTCCCGKISTKL